MVRRFKRTGPVPDRDSATVLRALRERKPLWRFLTAFCRAVDGAGGRSYLAGGLVRDLLEGKPGKDIDLMVTGVGFAGLGRLLRGLPSRELGLGRVHAVGKAFPVQKVRASWADEEIDVAPARVKRFPSRKRESADRAGDADAREDAARRDFTINSILFAFRPGKSGLSGSVVDFFGGVGDLERRLIRGVGEPGARFREDPLRILRAIRQKNERPGGTIEKITWKAILDTAPALVRAVPVERISAELLRGLSANPAGTVEDLSRAGILRSLFPAHGEDVSGRMKRRYRYLEKSLGRPLPSALLFANLLVDAAKEEFDERTGTSSRGIPRRGTAAPPAEDDRRTFRLPRTESAARRLAIPQIRAVVRLLEDRHRLAHRERLSNPHARIEAVFRRWDPPDPLIALYEAARKTEGGKRTDFAAWMENARKKPVLLTGKDLLDAGIPAGPRVDAILEEVREATLTGKIRRAEDAKSLAFSLSISASARPRGRTRFPRPR